MTIFMGYMTMGYSEGWSHGPSMGWEYPWWLTWIPGLVICYTANELDIVVISTMNGI